MKNKSKIVSVGLSLVFATVMAGGCGSSSAETKKVVASDTAAEAEEASADTAQEETTQEETAQEEATEEEQQASAAGDVSIDEQVLVDQDGIKVTALNYTTDTIMGDGINLLVENNSDQDYMVGCDALIVNDYMITDLFASDIAAGKKANETMYLSSAALNAAGIDSVGKVEMYFHAYDSGFNNLFQGVYSEIKTSNFDSMDTTPNDEGMELYNNGGIRIVGKTVDENSFWGTAILLYCENTSGQNAGISVDDMSVNGFMMSPFFSTTVYDGKKAIDPITIFSSDLEANGITAIESVELKFHIYNVDTFDTIADSEPITFSAQ